MSAGIAKKGEDGTLTSGPGEEHGVSLMRVMVHREHEYIHLATHDESYITLQSESGQGLASDKADLVDLGAFLARPAVGARKFGRVASARQLHLLHS